MTMFRFDFIVILLINPLWNKTKFVFFLYCQNDHSQMTSPKNFATLSACNNSNNNNSNSITSGTNNTSQIPSALTVSNRILRSPSHESFSTDLSLISISVSSMTSEATSVLNRSSCSLLTKTMEDKLGNLLLKDAKKNRYVSLANLAMNWIMQ